MRYSRLLSASVLFVLGAGCNRLNGADETRALEVPLAKRVLAPEQAQQLAATLCSAPATYERLKIAAFRQAAQVRGTDSAPFDRLAAFATVRVEEPLVVSGEQAPRVIRCTARMAIDLPPGTSAMSGARSLTSDVAFNGRPAADGSGIVWRLSSAEPIIYPLATLRRVTGEEFLPAPVVPAMFGGSTPGPADDAVTPTAPLQTASAPAELALDQPPPGGLPPPPAPPAVAPTAPAAAPPPQAIQPPSSQRPPVLASVAPEKPKPVAASREFKPVAKPVVAATATPPMTAKTQSHERATHNHGSAHQPISVAAAHSSKVAVKARAKPEPKLAAHAPLKSKTVVRSASTKPKAGRDVRVATRAVPRHFAAAKASATPRREVAIRKSPLTPVGARVRAARAPARRDEYVPYRPGPLAERF